MYYQKNKNPFYTWFRSKWLLKYFLLDTRQDAIAPVQAHRTAFLKFSLVWKEENSSIAILPI